jgi:TRAP-type C4-dicarboxylate transport system permease small subunit
VSGVKEVFLTFNDKLYQACVWIAGLSIVAMSLIIPWGIFARYVLGSGSQWPEPISILLMVIFTFLGASAGYRAGAHIAVAMVTERLPAGLRQSLEVTMTLLMGLVALFMLYYGARLCVETMGQSLPEIPAIKVGLTYLPVPISGYITLLFVVEKLWTGDQSQRPVVLGDAHLN